MSDGTACPNIFGIGVGHSQPANASQVRLDGLQHQS